MSPGNLVIAEVLTAAKSHRGPRKSCPCCGLLLNPVYRFYMRYKRNQIQEAIARLIEPGTVNPGAQTRARLKRLLEADRGLGRSKRSADPERANFAFFSMDAPGRGVEIWFCEYEAFALLTGLRLMQHGWPQGFAVSVLRRVRPEL